jgi:hypothetical protein
MSLLALSNELIEMIVELCPLSEDLLDFRLTCKTLYTAICNLFWTRYLHEFHAPITTAGLQRLRYVADLKRQRHVRSLHIDAGFFISTGPTTPQDAVEDIVQHPCVEDESIKWNNEAWQLVEDETLMQTYTECISQFPNLEGIGFRPPDLDQVFSEKNNRLMCDRWRLLLDSLLPLALQKVPHVRSIEIEDAFCRPVDWRTDTPTYRRGPIPIGAPLSIITTLFPFGQSFEALSTLKLSIMCESAVNKGYATRLWHGLQLLESLKSLHLSFHSDDSSAPTFFNDFVQGLDRMPLKHFGLTLLTPLPGSLPKLLSKCNKMESIALLLVGLSPQEWSSGLEQQLTRKTLVSLHLRHINVDKQGVDFSKYTRNDLWPAELELANTSNLATEFEKVQACSVFCDAAWSINDVLGH